MAQENQIYEDDIDSNVIDPDSIPIKDRKVVTQPYDLAVESLMDQIRNNVIFLRPLSERPSFQRRYVWTDSLASKLIESILLNVPIPPCYFSQNDDFELDVIDGQQRLFSIYRFFENQFKLTNLEVLDELNGKRCFEIDNKYQRQIKTHTMRCILITNESHPEIKFDVFERLNTNTVPLNPQELRNCIYRGALNDLLKDSVINKSWLEILGKKEPDKRMRDEELILRFYAFKTSGLSNYRTPLKHWLNSVSKDGRKFSNTKISNLTKKWDTAIENTRILFSPNECFRRDGGKTINRALFDLVTVYLSEIDSSELQAKKKEFKRRYNLLLNNEEFQDLISRAVDHTKRTKRRFGLWNEHFEGLF